MKTETCNIRCCTRPHVDGRTRCQFHIDQARASTAKYRQTRRDQGVCIRCGQNPSRPGTDSCDSCFQKRRRRYARRVEEAREPYYARRKAHLCTSCGKPVDPTDLYNGKPRRTCDTCRAEKRLRAIKHRYPQQQQRILERDNYMCQLCGEDKKRLNIHHKDGYGLSHNGIHLPVKQRNDSPDNLITLCGSCHLGITCIRQLDPDNRQKAIDLILA